MLVKFISFGCKVNLTETEYMKKTFAEAGFEVIKTDDADVFVINSCTVTDTADSKLKKTIRQLRRTHPAAIIAVTGCFVQAHPNVNIGADIMTGTSERGALPGIIKDYANNRPVPTVTETLPKVFEDFSVTHFSHNTRAFLKIQDGCNMNCAYCIIPKSRGHFRSKPLESVKKDAAALAAGGTREIVLTGINLAFYGIEFGLRLADAVEAVAKAAYEAYAVSADTALSAAYDSYTDTAHPMRIRLGSLEPEMFNDADIKRLAKIPGLCPQFHLSLQSACDKTLARMNRKYTILQYIQLVNKFRAYFPGCAITTDVMTGFPGETDEEFAVTLENLRAIGFADIHVFPFSRREGTAADTMTAQIPESVKHARARAVAEIAAYSKQVYHESMIGKIYSVLFEREKPGDTVPHGFAENYVKVMLHGVQLAPRETFRNRVLDVCVTGTCTDGVIGEVC
jgi:threonylcarbamoyladenosine tRNA methylthiotransferase MtaB